MTHLVNYVLLQAVTADRLQVICYGTGKRGSSRSMDLYLESVPFDGTQACKSVDPEMFFPEDYDDKAAVLQAKAICQSCPLTSACLVYAIKDSSLEGIWGATTPNERRNMRRRKRVLV